MIDEVGCDEGYLRATCAQNVSLDGKNLQWLVSFGQHRKESLEITCPCKWIRIGCGARLLARCRTRGFFSDLADFGDKVEVDLVDWKSRLLAGYSRVRRWWGPHLFNLFIPLVEWMRRVKIWELRDSGDRRWLTSLFAMLRYILSGGGMKSMQTILQWSSGLGWRQGWLRWQDGGKMYATSTSMNVEIAYNLQEWQVLWSVDAMQ